MGKSCSEGCQLEVHGRIVMEKVEVQIAVDLLGRMDEEKPRKLVGARHLDALTGCP